MTKDLYFDYAGISFRVKCDIEDDQVEHIYKVEAVEQDGKYVQLEIEPNEFSETMADVLSEAVEQAKLDEKLAHEDMAYETAREEGIL